MTALVELAGAVSHELNNIFTAVTGNLSLLEADETGESRLDGRLDEVIRTAERGIQLSSKLQAFAGRQPLKRVNVDVNEMVGRLVQRLPTALLKGIHVMVSLTREKCISFVDAEKLHNSLEEVLRNALAAMPDGGEINVETCLQVVDDSAAGRLAPVKAGRYVMIAVSDTGIGMTPEVAARAVEPLFTTKKQDINAGWGLSNCAGFVRQSGGFMTLASKVALGTRVELHLPLQ